MMLLGVWHVREPNKLVLHRLAKVSGLGRRRVTGRHFREFWVKVGGVQHTLETGLPWRLDLLIQEILFIKSRINHSS
jgi:hypothetical protein